MAIQVDARLEQFVSGMCGAQDGVRLDALMTEAVGKERRPKHNVTQRSTRADGYRMIVLNYELGAK